MYPEMTCLPATPLERASGLIGTRFRLHGRDPENGLDCVGLVACAYDCAAVPTGYALRGATARHWAGLLDHFAVRRPDVLPGQCQAAAQAGDIMLLHVGPAQYHLGIWTGGSLIHADAGLKRVVEMPGWPRWPVLGMWHRA